VCSGRGCTGSDLCAGRSDSVREGRHTGPPPATHPPTCFVMIFASPILVIAVTFAALRGVYRVTCGSVEDVKKSSQLHRELLEKRLSDSGVNTTTTAYVADVCCSTHTSFSSVPPPSPPHPSPLPPSHHPPPTPSPTPSQLNTRAHKHITALL
jgi:hypothetical protein